MLRNRYVIGGGILFALILANIINYLLSGWGLITVNVKEAPLGQVIKSIERQGWVRIYSDIDPTSPVTMTVIKVPLAEAMASLSVNIGGNDRQPRGGGGPGGPGGAGGAGAPGGGPGGGGPGGGGGGGGGAQWKLGFFAAPTSAQVKQEILNFEQGNVSDDMRVYSYGAALDMLGTSDPDTEISAADPRLQNWPGYKAPPVAITPAAGNTADDQAATPPPAPPAPPTTVQDYFKALAEEADIWIMAPESWAPNVPAPAPSSSIISAVKHLVGSAHGSVQQAIILTSRRRGGGQRGGGGGESGWVYTEDRMRNAINGLPPEERPDAITQLNNEVKFMHDVQSAQPDQRRAMMRDHFKDRMTQSDMRRSPEKRAQRYARAVANRQTARGQ